MAGLKAVGSELWFRPHPWALLAELTELIKNRCLTATPRLGIRDGAHPKGYDIGQKTDLKLFNYEDEPVLVESVEVTDLLFKPMDKLIRPDLRGCEPSCQSWRTTRNILSFFEQRALHPGEWSTIVRFAYLNQRSTYDRATLPFRG